MSNKKNYVRLDSLLSRVLMTFSMLLLSLITYKELGRPIDYDEAYNLQVVDSMARGQGYASYGSLRGEGLWFFDPHITTGPAILIPLAAIWAVSDGSIWAIRLFMMIFLWGFVVAIYYLLKKTHDKWIVFSIALASFLSPFNLQAGKVLGELPAVTVLIVAAALITRHRYVFAAFMIGVVIQIKLVFGLAGLILLSAPLLNRVFDGSRIRFNTILVMGIMVATPSIIFEFYRYYSFQSLQAYLYSIGEFKLFLHSQNINNFLGWSNPASMGAKFSGLYNLMPTVSWVAGALATSVIVISSCMYSRKYSNEIVRYQTNDSQLTRLVVVLLWLAGASLLWGWITQSNQNSARQGLPYLLISFPMISVLCASYCAELKHDDNMSKWIFSQVIIASMVGLLMGALVLNIKNVSAVDHSALLEDRAEVLRFLEKEKPNSVLVDGWWQNPEYQILTKIPFVPYKTGDAQMLLVQDYQKISPQSSWSIYKNQCADVVYSSDFNLLCWLPDFRASKSSIEVLDWGPQRTKAGVVPNRQSSGVSGIWIKIKKNKAEPVDMVKVYFNTFSAYHPTHLQSNGEVITAGIPPWLFKRPGVFEVSLKNAATGQRTHVGYFTVE
jgi:hypothetical protein